MNTSGPSRPRHFASDNNSGVCPEAWAALAEANRGHTSGYGEDPWTDRACGLIRDLFGVPCEVFFVFNGTAANALALAAACRPYHAVLCHQLAHIDRNECGAPEHFTGGARLWPLPGDHARLDPATLEAAIRSHFPLHSSKPGALGLSQATECGTVYRPADLATLAEVAHRHGLKVHLDGARFANAVLATGASPRELSVDAGVDILSLGCTKNGGLLAEALVVFDPELARDLEYRIKQSGQLASKMRFLSASWIGLLESGAWLRHAAQANAMARLLAEHLTRLTGQPLLHPCETNAVFVDLPVRAIEQLHARGWHFYVFTRPTGCRLMCSWDTTPEDVREFTRDLADCL